MLVGCWLGVGGVWVGCQHGVGRVMVGVGGASVGLMCRVQDDVKSIR